MNKWSPRHDGSTNTDGDMIKDRTCDLQPSEVGS